MADAIVDFVFSLLVSTDDVEGHRKRLREKLREDLRKCNV